MTRYCSKKVVILCLCVTTILASLLIGKNIYHGTPTLHSNVESKSISRTDPINTFSGSRQIDNRPDVPPDNLNLTLIRQGGLEQFKPAADASVWEEDEDDAETDSSEMENNQLPAVKVQRPVVNKPASPGRTFDFHVGLENKRKDVTAGNGGNDYTLMSDPRMPRLLKKLLEKLPREILQDIPPAYRKFVFKNTRQYFMKQWKVVNEVAAKHGYSQRLPDLINIGVKKSGTNAVGFFVTQHPQIAHSLGNEVHFFDRNYEKGLEYYRQRMGFAKADQFIFEKTPKYFVTKNAPAQIAKDLPKHVKFILCVRDPVKRALSDFRHEQELAMRRKDKMKFRNKGFKTSPEEQGKTFEDQVLDKNGQVNASNMIIDTSNFGKHLKHWLDYFPRDRFMVIDLDTLEKGAFHKLKELEKFVGLDPYFKEEMFYYDKARHGMCMHGKFRPCPAKSTPGVLPKAKLSDATIKKLYDFYRPSNKELMRLTGQDFEWAYL